jgi:RHS repeat-associated protein
VPDNPSSTTLDAGQSPPESPFSAPQLNLPKGGGAIRGIGEKFTANAANGTGSLTIPIAFSSGRADFGPRYSLAYESGAGNGEFGIGWSMALQEITRKTDKGLPVYRDCDQGDNESEVFILSGHEDLVRVLRETEHFLSFDEFESEGYRVQRYRSRVEGLFARIERWTRLEDGDQHWRSISKDNVLTVYGSTPESRIFDPENPAHVFSWLICQSYDDKGNAIVYEYVSENDVGVDVGKCSEHNRVRTANRYLKRILYGNRLPLMLDDRAQGFRRPHLDARGLETAGWMFEAVFDYGDEESSEERNNEEGAWVHFTPGAGRCWPVRKDPFSSYRSCFEIRTYRLCHRILMLHHFPEEGVDGLVRSTEFEYRQKEIGSFITKATQSGYVREADGRYLKKSMPAVELDYTASPLEDERYRRYEVKEVDSRSVENLPGGIDGKNYQWVDLDGEGISGVLTEQGGSWYYKPNAGRGRFGATEVVARTPSLAALSQGKQQLLDLAGDGSLDLVQFDASAPGYFNRTEETGGAQKSVEKGWDAFRAFRSLPVLDWKDPNLRFVDVTGDGIADILITDGDSLIWHPSLLEEGFGRGVRVPVPSDERQGPQVIFADAAQSVYLADMSGDGLSDIVRIRNGEVCYWPNRGRGFFGHKLTMHNAPWFEENGVFDQSRVRLADTDGSGPTDIVYLAGDSIRIYLNQAGNGWSEARVLPQFAAANAQTSVSVVDFLGRGTACLVWSSSLPADSGQPLRYIDLMDGQKPHLLVKIQNNLGAETRIEYASSTEFYLADKALGRPWVTRLPFPVQVVKRVETYDYVSRNRFVGSYTYHHGFFDGLEREFRGFGRVEQLDTEEFAALSRSDAFPMGTNVDRASNVPPVLTKTWFHTGVYLGSGRFSRYLAHEYYREPGDSDPLRAMLVDDTILPGGLTAEEAREACRSLKGSMLRQEVYALDGTEESGRPYTVSESNATIHLLQPRHGTLHAVFFTHAREAVTFHYERKLYEVEGGRRADPRVTHEVTLEVDDYGNVLKAASIGYGRRFADPSPLLTDSDRAKQRQILLTFDENRYTNAVENLHAYRAPVAAESRRYQLIHVSPRSRQLAITNLFRFEELETQIARASDGRHDIPFEDVDAVGTPDGVPYRRLILENRRYYRADRLDRILPLGVVEALALPGQSYKLCFTPGLLAQVYHREEPRENLIPDRQRVLQDEGKYVDLAGDGRWWIPSGKVHYAPHESGAREELEEASRHFFLARRYVDPFHYTTEVSYDAHDLMPVFIRDAVGNTVRAEIEYRVLTPWRVTDANRNRSEASFDALGMVAGTAIMGKHSQQAGDSLEGFGPDLNEATILEHLAHPLHNPYAILKLATTRLVYDLFAYARTRDSAHPEPAAVYTIARETHAADLRPGQRTKVHHSFSYSDGFGSEIQKKIQAEPGPLSDGGREVNPRWIGSGWTIFNNKGKPIRQYEPFFTALHTFEFDRLEGVSSILFYDPVERVVATLHANHTYEKVVFDPWRQENWDVNDTVLQTNPARDPDVGDFFAKLPDAEYLPVWYSQRIDGQLGPEEKQAGVKTAVHANTPGIAYADSLGRTFLSIAHNRLERGGATVDEYFATRTELDIQSNKRSITDALGRVCMRYEYDMLSTSLRQISSDAGTRWNINNAVGKLMLRWDSRRHWLRHEYDGLRRPTDLRVRTGTGPEILAERIVYGEGQQDDLALNLRAKPFRQFDAAGIVTNEHYDFKGNLLRSTRRLLEDYKNTADWSRDLEMEPAVFTTSTEYDALNRAIALRTPDASVARPKYNQTNQLESLWVNLRGAKEATPFVTYINYNPKGQRQIIEYSNGAHTHYGYDPLTFRLIHLMTRRKHDESTLQDLHYTLDPVGNITSIRDDAQETVYFKNQLVSPNNEYVYDAIYRLIWADGREHAGRPGEPRTTYDDAPRMKPLPSDGHALHRYREQYDYDPLGNILRLLHSAQEGNWSRFYDYDEPDNRLTGTRVGQHEEAYTYDADGNMTRMPHLRRMDWDYKDQLHATRVQEVNTGRGETIYYVYDSAGQRARKVTERASGSRKHERVYVGRFEIYREFSSVGQTMMERETLHVMDDKQRISLVETKTVEEGARAEDPTTLIRMQLGNHLGSSVLELDEHAAIISYEEYYPYGSTSYEAMDHRIKAARKRYRFIGKERDEETGLYYHGARYYAPWLGRWTACDPAGFSKSPNPYEYVSSRPIVLFDQTGLAGSHWIDIPLLDELAEAVDRNMDAEARSRAAGQAAPPKEKESLPVVAAKEALKAANDLNKNPVVGAVQSAETFQDEFVAAVVTPNSNESNAHTIKAAAAAMKFTVHVIKALGKGPKSESSEEGAGPVPPAQIGPGSGTPSGSTPPTTPPAGGGGSQGGPPSPPAGGTSQAGPPSPPASPGAPAGPPAPPATPAGSAPPPKTVDPSLGPDPNQRPIPPHELPTQRITVPPSGRGIGEGTRRENQASAARQGFSGKPDTAHITAHVFTKPGDSVLVRPQSSSINRGEGSDIARAAAERRAWNASNPNGPQLPVRDK